MRVRCIHFNCPIIALIGLIPIARPLAGQRCTGVNGGRVAAISGAVVAGVTAVTLARKDAWWTTPTSGFSLAWDVSPSKGQDRYLHAFASYQISQVGALAWDWACVPRATSGWLGAALAVAVALPKEIGDGLHAGKDFSIPDMLGTVVGAALPALHRSLPPSRALLLKFNYWPSDEFRNRTSEQPTLASDYAGQRYYLAFNPGRLPGGAGRWPDWLGVAVGHSVPHWNPTLPVHQWYFTLDLNARGIPIHTRWWHSVATVLDQIHFPLPGIRLQQGDFQLGFF